MFRKNTRDYILAYHQLLKECDMLYHRAAVKAGLSDCAFWIMYTLQDTSHIYTQSEIGDHAAIPRQTINSALKKLERDGYLKLRRVEGKMGKTIHLTEMGMDFSKAYIKPIQEAEERTCSAFSDDEKDALLCSFQAFVEKLTEETGECEE